MINVLALCFVMTTLVTAGVVSPSPERRHKDDTTVEKEGHRVVVVEFDKDDGNTKVSISTQEQKGQKSSDRLMEGKKEKLEREDIHHSHMGSAKDLVCDAFGKCKHKIDSAIGRTKEAVDKVDEEAHLAKEREKVKERAHEVKGAAKRGGENVMETAKIIKGEAERKADEEAQEAKERVKDVGSEKVKEKAREVKEGAKRGGEIVMETAKIIKGEAERNVCRKFEATIEKAKEAKEMVEEKVKEQWKKGLKKFLFDVLGHSLWLKSMGILHLLGFATAYGMCVWVTFLSSYVLASALARQQFASVQSKIYPVYFKAMAYSVGLALVGYLMSKQMEGVVILQGFNLLAPLLMIMVNMLYLEPKATKVHIYLNLQISSFTCIVKYISITSQEIRNCSCGFYMK